MDSSEKSSPSSEDASRKTDRLRYPKIASRLKLKSRLSPEVSDYLKEDLITLLEGRSYHAERDTLTQSVTRSVLSSLERRDHPVATSQSCFVSKTILIKRRITNTVT